MHVVVRSSPCSRPRARTRQDTSTMHEPAMLLDAVFQRCRSTVFLNSLLALCALVVRASAREPIWSAGGRSALGSTRLNLHTEHGEDTHAPPRSGELGLMHVSVRCQLFSSEHARSLLARGELQSPGISSPALQGTQPRLCTHTHAQRAEDSRLSGVHRRRGEAWGGRHVAARRFELAAALTEIKL